jgi:hypothetical protein
MSIGTPTPCNALCERQRYAECNVEFAGFKKVRTRPGSVAPDTYGIPLPAASADDLPPNHHDRLGRR